MVENKITRNKYFYSTAVFGITAIAVIVLVFAVIVPFFNKARELTTEANAYQAELQRLEDKKAKLEELKTREEQLKKDAETVKNALPEEKDVGRLFIELDRMARSSGGTIQSVTESQGTNVAPAAGAAPTTTDVGSASTGVEKVTYTVPIEFKDYFGMKDFITKAETALRIVGIEDFSVNVGEGTGLVTVSVNTVTYVRK